MVFKHLPDSDSKTLKLESYIVSINESVSARLYNHLFGTINIMDKINVGITDDLLNNYIKTVVADEFTKQIKIVKGNIYKISIVTHLGNTIDMMLSLHDKLDEIFY